MPHFIPYPLPLILILLILLLTAKVLGEIFERFGQPSMIGEVLAGVILGPAVFNIIGSNTELKVIADLGIFLMIAMAGMEINAEEIRKSVKGRNAWIAVLGFLVPFGFGILTGLLFNYNYTLSIFIGLSIAITALPVSVRILMDIGRLDSEIGRRIISAAIFNDILSLLILGIILDFKDESKSLGEMLVNTTITTVKVAGFILLLILAYKIFQSFKNHVGPLSPRVERVLTFIQGRKSYFAIVILFILAFASVAELLGIHLIVGAFFGAILFPRKLFTFQQFDHTKETTENITMGFLAPIAFAYIGISFDYKVISDWWFLLAILSSSFISKILGGFAGGKLAGYGARKALTLGYGLNARGMMELVIASIALQKGVIDLPLYSALVIVALLTTVFTPFLLKKSFGKLDREGSA